ncbi:MAG: YggT family protein [Gemmatimonadota bacterium]|nr:MAG: YggT family protein [Gemmatimonadota bacterium]
MMVLNVVRILVFAVFALSALAALGSWAVRTRRVNPFGSLGQTIRRMTDPVLQPIERWLITRGTNPQNAGWWLLGISVVGGIILVTMAEWVIVQMVRLASAGQAGPRGIVRLLVYYAAQLITIALVVRVIGSWFGKGRTSRWMRLAYRLTDWIVEPLRRFVPRVGMFDITPLVAYLLIQWLLLPLIMRVI